MSRDPRLRTRAGPEGCLKARRAPCDPQFRQSPGMSALRPLDKLPGLNTATILVGVSSPDSRARLSSWAALSGQALCGSLRFWPGLLRRECGGRESLSLKQSEFAALLTPWDVSTNKCSF